MEFFLKLTSFNFLFIYRGVLNNCNKFIVHSIGENNKKDTTFTRYEFEFELNCLKDFVQSKKGVK